MSQVRTISREVVIDPSETTRRAPFTENELCAYLQGALHDASLNKQKRYRFTQKGTDWLNVIKDVFEELGYQAWIYKEGENRDVYALETLAEFLDFDLDPLQLENQQERLSYIRGFFDAEGGVPQKSSNRFYIQLVQKDKEKMEKIKRILEASKIYTGVIHNPSKRVDPEYWRLFVAARSYQAFVQLVGSWHPKKAQIFRERMKI